MEIDRDLKVSRAACERLVNREAIDYGQPRPGQIFIIRNITAGPFSIPRQDYLVGNKTLKGHCNGGKFSDFDDVILTSTIWHPAHFTDQETRRVTFKQLRGFKRRLTKL